MIVHYLASQYHIPSKRWRQIAACGLVGPELHLTNIPKKVTCSLCVSLMPEEDQLKAVGWKPPKRVEIITKE